MTLPDFAKGAETVIAAAVSIGLGLLLLAVAGALVLSGRIRDDEEAAMAEEVRKRAEAKRPARRPFIQEHRIDYAALSKEEIARVFDQI